MLHANISWAHRSWLPKLTFEWPVYDALRATHLDLVKRYTDAEERVRILERKIGEARRDEAERAAIAGTPPNDVPEELSAACSEAATDRRAAALALCDHAEKVLREMPPREQAEQVARGASLGGLYGVMLQGGGGRRGVAVREQVQEIRARLLAAKATADHEPAQVDDVAAGWATVDDLAAAFASVDDLADILPNELPEP